MTVDVIGKTVEQAMAFVPGTKQMIIHSDRGVLYKTKAYRNLCKGYYLTPSMSRPSTPTDNGQTESLNERLGMPPMEYYYLHKNDKELIANLHTKDYSNFYEIIDFV